jgi:sugar phosphate isomerase/epimerase
MMRDATPAGEMKRREWLLASGAGAAGLALSGAATAAPLRERDPRAPVRAPPFPPGLQLYTVRSLLSADVPGTLREVAAIGYRVVELAGLHGLDAGAFRRHLDDAGLAAPSGHVPIDDLRSRADRVLAEAASLGHRTVVVPWLEPSERTPDGYRRVADDLNAAGRRAREHGVRVAHHNQGYDLERFDGVCGWDLLLERTEPELVTMQMDVFWAVSGGADPRAYLLAHPGRFTSLHAKDRTPSGDMVAVGEGAIDFATILAEASEGGVEHVFVEHDEPRDPIASIRASYETLAALEI